MLIQGQVGPSSAQSVTPGATPAVRLGQQGDLIASQLHGRYYETTYRKNMFTSATTAAVTLSAGTATTYTGLILTNAPGNTVNCVLNKVGIAQLIQQPTAAATVGIMVGQSFTPLAATATAVVTKNAFVGGPAGQGVCLTATTITTAITSLQTVLMTALTGAINTTTFQPGFFDIEGGIVLPPGAYAALYWSVASSTTGVWASFQWEELPI